MWGRRMQCKNGHEIEARIIRSDGKAICPVCHRASHVRRARKYRALHGDEINRLARERRLFG